MALLPATLINSLAFAASSLSKQQRAGSKFPLSTSVIFKQVNGIYQRSSDLRVQSKWAGAVVAGTTSSPALHESGQDDDDDENWEKEIFEDFSRPSGRFGSRSRDWGDEDVSALKKEEEAQVDWSAKTRQRAIKAIEERELPVGALLGDGKKKRRKKKKKKAATPEVRWTKAKLERLEKIAKSIDEKVLISGDDRMKEPPLGIPLMKAMGSGDGFEGLAGLGNYWKSLGNETTGDVSLEDAVVKSGKGESMESSNRIAIPTPKSGDRSRSPGHSAVPSKQKRQEDFDLNRKLVMAANAAEVLSVVGDVLEDGMWGEESPLSPFNVSTALHRIAKHMDAASMHKSDRLAFARQKVMAQLVSAAVEVLPNCSTQSISNISWALSKVGGYSLYSTEMNLIAAVAMKRLPDLEPQHIANIAGAFASMQHSVPPLLEALERRASGFPHKFQSQELAQLLWAFATLDQSAKLLLDSLDAAACESSLKVEKRRETTDFRPTENDDMLPLYLSDSFLVTDSSLNSQQDVGKNPQGARKYFQAFSFSELASLAWSYTVLGELERPSFALVWQALLERELATGIEVRDLPSPTLQLSQLYQTNVSLQLEYPHLGLSLGELLESLARNEWEAKKIGHKSTSVTQLNVERLLVGTGRRWVAEYTDAEYSLDAALVEEKICVEIDGPSHFARNTGTPLGHTMLKRRQLGAAGWTVLSIPYHEWDDQIGEHEQRLYLHNLMKEFL